MPADEATVGMASADVAADEAAGARGREARPDLADNTAWTSAQKAASADSAAEPELPCRSSGQRPRQRGEERGSSNTLVPRSQTLLRCLGLLAN